MQRKNVSEKEFNNIWLRTGKDPHGSDMPEIILGKEDGSYRKYLLKNQIELKFYSQGEVLYIWRSMDDDRVREGHRERDDETFDWNSSDIKPGENYGCRCYAEFLDNEGNPNGKYGRITWPEKGTEPDPKPYFEPSDKNGVPLNKKSWRELSSKEKELRKKEELAKFKNSYKIKENIKEAKKMRGKSFTEKVKWMKKNFMGGAKYDYKKGGHPEMEHVGNFNYGVMGKAIGFADLSLKLGAGGYQIYSNTSDLSFWNSWGDDPIDQEYIKEGIDWYNNFGNKYD